MRPPTAEIRFAGRTWFAVAIGALLTMPFLFVRIPPLTDLPGHMGSAAAAAYADDPAFASLIGFHWRLLPNLGTDLIVSALRRAVGITEAYWIAAAMIPPLLVTGICMIARILNARGAAAIGWALLFVYSYPFNYGFLNYMLGVALALIGFALWMRLDRHPRARELATWVWLPLLFLCHAVAGCLFALLVASREFGPAPRGDRRALLHRLRPLLSSFVIILVWRLRSQSFAGHNEFSLNFKLNAVIMLLRDQNRFLDEGSLVAALIVFVVGWRRGARPHPAVRPALLLLFPLFIVTPSTLNGSSFADERLLPLIPILAFATQDWRGVGAGLARLVAVSGLCLLAVRLGLTVAGFVDYDARYAAELGALRHVPEHSRIIVLNTRHCSARLDWRQSRLGHLGDLAIVYRRSWTNSEWDTDGAHLLEVRYRPSPLFYDDPSQYVWMPSCGGGKVGRPTMREALSRLPLGGIDYLWLVDAALPAGQRHPRLALRWHDDVSALYAVLPAAGATARAGPP